MHDCVFFWPRSLLLTDGLLAAQQPGRAAQRRWRPASGGEGRPRTYPTTCKSICAVPLTLGQRTGACRLLLCLGFCCCCWALIAGTTAGGGRAAALQRLAHGVQKFPGPLVGWRRPVCRRGGLVCAVFALAETSPAAAAAFWAGGGGAGGVCGRELAQLGGKKARGARSSPGGTFG